MRTVILPYHIDERLPDSFDAGAVTDTAAARLAPELPQLKNPWLRMASLYRGVVDFLVHGNSPVVVVSGDCTTSIGTMAGLQRGGLTPGVVWFDAHGDFHTEATTISGYLGGLPLAKIAGHGDLAILEGLGMSPVAEHRILLVGARDLDPGERETLAASAVHNYQLDQLVRAPDVDLPDGPIYLHVDVDVIDPEELTDVRFPAPGGPSSPLVLEAVRRVLRTGRVVATGLGCTWYPDRGDPARRRAILTELLTAVASAWR